MGDRVNTVQAQPSIALTALASIWLTGCSSEVSTLAPGGQGAAEIAWITWVMIIGCGVLMLMMTALWLHAVYRKSARPVTITTRSAVLLGGLALPVVVITLLLVYGVRTGQSMLPIGQPDLEVRVTAYQWFWEFEYETSAGRVTRIDELYLPVGRRIDFHVATEDVIHSFWIPSLGGKIDAVPGRVNTLRLEPTRTGRFRGQCAEFCGALHAHMAFEVNVVEPEAFEAWLEENVEDPS